MSPHTLINGLEEDAITVHDRGLHYGDGLFETFAVIHSEPQYWERHYRRLACGCERLKLPLPEEGLLRMEPLRSVEGSSVGYSNLSSPEERGTEAIDFLIRRSQPACFPSIHGLTIQKTIFTTG